MDLLLEYRFSVEHQHSDGSWSPLVEDSSHHDSAAHDPERGWVRRIFRCPSCNETVALKTAEDAKPPDAE
jgi:hypothetical protein